MPLVRVTASLAAFLASWPTSSTPARSRSWRITGDVPGTTGCGEQALPVLLGPPQPEEIAREFQNHLGDLAVGGGVRKLIVLVLPLHLKPSHVKGGGAIGSGCLGTTALPYTTPWQPLASLASPCPMADVFAGLGHVPSLEDVPNRGASRRWPGDCSLPRTHFSWGQRDLRRGWRPADEPRVYTSQISNARSSARTGSPLGTNS